LVFCLREQGLLSKTLHAVGKLHWRSAIANAHSISAEWMKKK
jgi:hypothetical protein